MATLGGPIKAVLSKPDNENVAIVFKDRIGYDPDKLLVSVRGCYGQY